MNQNPEGRFEVARLVHEMIDLTQQFLDGSASRAELVAWSRVEGHRFHTPAADGLSTCLWNCDLMLQTGEPLVRRVDLADHLRELREGGIPFDQDEFIVLTLSVEQVAARLRREVTRIPIDGLGWFTCVRFASLATGRPFASISLRDFQDPRVGSVVRTHGFPDAEESREAVVSDLLDTLGIDLDEVTHSRGVVSARWDLTHADEYGNVTQVASFSGYAKARARLVQFEAQHSGQTYSLQRRV
jgi:hypothetical protein